MTGEGSRAAICLHHSCCLLRRDAPQPAQVEEETHGKDILEAEAEANAEAEADAEPQALIQTAASLGTSVWGRLFLSRRVRPDSAGSRASVAMSAAPRWPCLTLCSNF